jgi:hypothetical protein
MRGNRGRIAATPCGDGAGRKMLDARPLPR